MAAKMNNQESDSQGSLGNKPDAETESKNTNKDLDKQGRLARDTGGSDGSLGTIEDETVDTAGGREGQFSDKERANQEKWSPGSGVPHTE